MSFAARLLSASLIVAPVLHAQSKPSGMYTNPVLFSDYSDPDVIRDGSHFYLVASTFEYSPGLPILESPDLVHWTIIAHALPRLDLGPQYDLKDGNRYGKGVWAPALRKHNGLFYLYFPTPDEGIFVVTAPAITGPWSRPKAIIAGPGYEDPCPFWDDDGNAYLIHSMKGAGPLIIHRMAPDGLSVLDDGKLVFKDLEHFRALEGPKLYKRNGWYYIWAPFGGVGTGSQVVFRAKNIYGPYEYRIPLTQGTTDINGPHQGGYVESPDGRGWFLHFQQRGGYGRIDHLEPVRWQDDWPLIGEPIPDPARAQTSAGIATGQPVLTGPLPVPGNATQRPQTSDDFSSSTLGQQWEWNHNPDNSAWSLTARKGWLRLTATQAADLFTAHNTLTQQMQDKNLTYTVRLDLSAMQPGDHTGLAMFEQKASGVEVIAAPDGTRHLHFFHQAESFDGPALKASTLQLQLRVKDMAVAYSYSTDDGKTFTPFGPESTPIAFSWWKGSRPAVFAYTTAAHTKPSHIDIDWVHYQPQP